MTDHENRPRLVSDSATSNDDTVERLLRMAGHRPEVPARDAAIVEEAARLEWRRAVKERRRKAWMVRGGGLLAAAALVLLVLNRDLLIPLQPDTVATVATVEAVNGPVRAASGEDAPAGVVSGAELLPGAVIETGPFGESVASARVAFRLAGGTSIRLDAGSRVRILAADRLALDRGAVYADSGAEPGRAIAIDTPLGVVTDVGTQFEVRLDDTASRLEVRVREGTVIVETPDDRHQISADGGRAVELTVSADGDATRRAVACYGPRWSWVHDASPPLGDDSGLVVDILEWAARESCWRLSYADPSLERRAAVPLEGAMSGLTPEEAVALALPAAGLSYRLEDGVLTVEP